MPVPANKMELLVHSSMRNAPNIHKIQDTRNFI